MAVPTITTLGSTRPFVWPLTGGNCQGGAKPPQIKTPKPKGGGR